MSKQAAERRLPHSINIVSHNAGGCGSVVTGSTEVVIYDNANKAIVRMTVDGIVAHAASLRELSGERDTRQAFEAENRRLASDLRKLVAERDGLRERAAGLADELMVAADCVVALRQLTSGEPGSFLAVRFGASLQAAREALAKVAA